MPTKLNFTAKAAAIEKAIKESMQIAGKDAQLFFQKSFYNEGFTDDSLQPWKPRKGSIRSLGAKSLGRKTLTKTGKLRRSIRFVSSLNGMKVTVFTDLPYAEIHNEGGTINKEFNRKILSFDKHGRFISANAKEKVGTGVFNVKSHKERNSWRSLVSHQQQVTISDHVIRMPKRKFLGNSHVLERRTLAKMRAKIKTALLNAA